ncbi:MAG: hypothetical protein V4555_08750 [Acidobacteriota bacterium]
MTPSANPPNLRPIRPVRPATLIIVIAIFLVLAAAGVTSLCLAFANSLPTAIRIILLLGAIAGLAAPAYAVAVTTRRYLRTGELLPSLDERLSNRRRFAQRLQSPRYQLRMTLFFRAAAIVWLAAFLTFTWAFITHPAHRLHDLLWVAIAAFNTINFWPRAKRSLHAPQPQPSA